MRINDATVESICRVCFAYQLCYMNAFPTPGLEKREITYDVVNSATASPFSSLSSTFAATQHKKRTLATLLEDASVAILDRLEKLEKEGEQGREREQGLLADRSAQANLNLANNVSSLQVSLSASQEQATAANSMGGQLREAFAAYGRKQESEMETLRQRIEAGAGGRGASTGSSRRSLGARKGREDGITVHKSEEENACSDLAREALAHARGVGEENTQHDPLPKYDPSVPSLFNYSRPLSDSRNKAGLSQARAFAQSNKQRISKQVFGKLF